MVGSFSIILYLPKLIFLIQVLFLIISLVQEFFERAIAREIASGNHHVAIHLVQCTSIIVCSFFHTPFCFCSSSCLIIIMLPCMNILNGNGISPTANQIWTSFSIYPLIHKKHCTLLTSIKCVFFTIVLEGSVKFSSSIKMD